MMQPNAANNAGNSNTALPFTFPASSSHHASDPSLPFNLDPYTAKQMAALQATSLAKAGNRSAPGGTSAPYFGGMSMGQQVNQQATNPISRTEPSQDHLNAIPSMADFQAPNQYMNPNPVPNHANSSIMQQQMLQHKKRQLLNGVANIMTQRNVPLPPALTGIPPPPTYDPNHWKWLEVVPGEIGIIRLAGKDIDLFKLWGCVIAAGGNAKISQRGMWGHLLPQFDLPDHIMSPTGEQQSVAMMLAHCYMKILGPFEEAYRRNAADHQQRALMAGRMASAQQQQPPPGSSHGRPGSISGMPPLQPGSMTGPTGSGTGANMLGHSIPSTPTQSMDSSLTAQFPPSHGSQFPHQSSNGLNIAPDARPGFGPTTTSDASHAGAGIPQLSRSQSTIPGFPLHSGGQDVSTELEHDTDSRKRKMRESEEMDAKRVRQKTGGSDASDPRSSVAPERGSLPPSASVTSQAPAPTRTIRQPSRRKIEYIPFAREVETAGGRDLDVIQREWARAAHRPFKNFDDWGQVDIDALTMSLRSRIATEMSYALTTFTVLTLMRGPHKDAGYPVNQSPELFDETLDLLEELAFEGQDDDDMELGDDCTPIVTHRELINTLMEEGTRPFAALESRQGSKDPTLGPRPRPGDTILFIINILRNLSTVQDNHEYLATHDKFFTILLRLCSLAPPDKSATPAPLSPALSLSDLVTVRREMLNILINIAGLIFFPPTVPSRGVQRHVRRTFELLASFIADPVEAVPPFNCILLSGKPVQQPQPPAAADLALDVFMRLAHPDGNREAFSHAIPQPWLWTVAEALVHRLPVADHDFQVMTRDPWLAYVEKVMFALYSLAFLAPPALKRRLLADRALGFARVLVRIATKLLVHAPPEYRTMFSVLVRRAIETLRLVDDGEDAFDTSQAALPTLTFGMGYGEHGESRIEKGTGLLGGYQEEFVLGVMMQMQDFVDKVVFEEVDSLVRVE